jgi:REP element-mobilizing transposase RayT
LSPAGVAAQDCLVEIHEHHRGVDVDAFVVMPNHVHAILTMGRDESLGAVVGTYKAAVSRRTGHRALWQRGYYDHIIRDEQDLARVREYIATNPIRWAFDPEHPLRTS